MIDCKKAMESVFREFSSPADRSHAIAFLGRYADRSIPVTAWHSSCGDGSAIAALLGGLGFVEGTHYETVRSALDPNSVRFGWTPDGVRLLGELTDALAGSGFSAAAAQRRLIAGDGDPLDGIPAASAAEAREPAAEEGGAEAPDPCAMLAARTEELLGRVSTPRGIGDFRAERFPVAPLWALEMLAREDGADWLPEFRVFVPDAWSEMQASRPVKPREILDPMVPLGLIPLQDQVSGGAWPCVETDFTSCLDSYFSQDAEDWLSGAVTKGRPLAWTVFNARLSSDYRAVQFALDAERMRRFAERLVEHGYPGFTCRLTPNTRLAVHNGFAGGSLPGADDLDGDLAEYIDDNSRVPEDAVLYVGGHVMARAEDGFRPAAAAEMAWTPETRPVRMAGDPGADIALSKAREIADRCGMTSPELPAEWFMITHGVPVPKSSLPHEEPLEGFRTAAANLADSSVLNCYCSPESASLAVSADAPGRTETPAGAFVNGICVALRKYLPGVEFVSGSPHHPDMMVAGVWSGMYVSGRSPAGLTKAIESRTFPDLGPDDRLAVPFDDIPSGSLPVAARDATSKTSLLLDALRKHPDIQLGCSLRKSGDTALRHSIVIVETNVSASAVISAIRNDFDVGRNLQRAIRRAFLGAFAFRSTDPFLAVMPERCPDHLEGDSNDLFSDAVYAERPRCDARMTAGHNEFDLGTAGSQVPHGWHLRVGWRVDDLGRLIVVAMPATPEMALRVRLAFRYSVSVPLASAGLLMKSAGAPFQPTGNGGEDYTRLVCAAADEHGFWTGDSPGEAPSRHGRFGVLWSMGDETAELNLSNEVPDRSWYVDHETCRFSVDQVMSRDGSAGAAS